MKKLISVLLITAMLVSVLCVSATADGIVFSADFSKMNTEQFYQQFMNGLFFVDDTSGLLCGYYDAKALQSMYDDSDGDVFSNTLNTWLTYDAAITLAVSDDDAVDAERCVNIAYCNDNLRAAGEAEGRSFITLVYDIENKKFEICNNSMPVFDETTVIADPISMELDVEGGQFYTFGMSVDKNRIRFFLDNQLLYDIDGTQYRIGEQINSPFFLWNGGNFMQIKELKVSTAGYLYPYATDPAETVTDPAGGNETTTPKVTTTSEKVVTVTDASGNAVTDASGNVVTSVSVVTEAPAPADTNNNKPAGGNATSTGDATFVVIVAMVAALGCAVIIKKVNAD